MSKEMEVFEIHKCISSKLWYTAYEIYRTYHHHNICSEQSTDMIHNIDFKSIIKIDIDMKKENNFRWIEYLLLYKLFPDKCCHNKNISMDFNSIDFQIAVDLMDDISQNVIEELLLYCSDVNIKAASPQIVNDFSQSTLSFLKAYLIKNPIIACHIINMCCLYSFSISIFPNGLLDFYLTALKEIMELMIPNENSHVNEKDDASSFIQNKIILNNEYLEIFLCILSKMILTESKKTEFLKWLCPITLKTDNIKDIELALYSRKDTTFIDEWNLNMNELYGYSKSGTIMEDAIRICNAIFKYKNNDNIMVLNEMEILRRIITQKSHWLTDILNICYTFLITGNYNEVSMILSYPPLKHFWIILLLKFLHHCSEGDTDDLQNWTDNTIVYEVLKFLLQNCNLKIFTDHTFHKLDTTLKTYTEIINWILNLKNSEVIKESQDGIESVCIVNAIPLKRMLYLLENCTVLFLLKEATNIHEIDHDRIKELLQGTGEPENIFQAYCSMVNALKVILLCKTYSAKYQNITKYLLDMESYLCTLLPFSLRLETMENIFSLLFLSYDDFCHSDNKSQDHNIVLNEKQTIIHKSMKYNNMNFICNKYAVREILYYLKNSITATEIEMRKLKYDATYAEELNKLSPKISNLVKLLADAKWRLDLHTNSYFIKNVGLPDNFTIETNSGTLLKENIIYPQERFNDIVFYRNHSSDSDDTKIKTDSSSEVEIVDDNINEWNQLKNITISDNLIVKDADQPIFLINLMLSSKESLVIQCLWKNDYEKAQEVIEMFNMENTALYGEIRFSQALKHFKQEIFNLICPSIIGNTSKRNIKSSTLETIRLVAEEAMHSSRYTNQLETFIASQETHMRMLKPNLNNNKILTLSVLDLALTMGNTYPISQSLCDVAMKYVTLCKSLNNTEHSRLFYQVFQLLHENKKDIPVTNLLSDVTIPLSVEEWKEKNELWTNIMTEYNEFKKSQKQIVDDEHAKNSIEFKELKIIQKIITSCNNNKNYLKNLQFHLQHLKAIAPINTDNTELLTATRLLNIPLHRYFSYHLFNKNVEPENLEQIARKLKVDLVYNILISTCPIFPYYHNNKSENDNTNFGCIILNGNVDISDSKSYVSSSPNQCISEILMELLQALYTLNSMKSNLSYTCLNDLSKHVNIQTILKKTSHLAMLDLSELSVGDETLTFFLNTWNVMFIHAMLVIWANNSPFNTLKHTVSLMSIGYVIGDLGFVTLYTLRSKLLSGLSLNEITLSPIIELNEPAWQDLDLVHDPRVIFAMANEYNETPQIRVFESTTLSKNLNVAAKEYLDYYLQKNYHNDDFKKLHEKTKIILPNLVEQYQNLLSLDKQNENANSLKENIFSINDYFQFENEDVVIEYKSAHYSYEILLKYTESSQLSIQNCQNDDNEEVFIREKLLIKDNLLQYLDGHSWILSYLVQKMQNKRPTILDKNCNNLRRIACLENFLNSSWINQLKCFFNENETYTGIHETVPANKLWNWFKEAWKNKKWEDCLNVIDSLSDNNIVKTFEVRHFKDKVLSCLTSEKENTLNSQILEYLYQINDIHILAQMILNNINKWQAYVCECILIHALHHTDSNKLPLHCKLQMKEILRRITIFRKMLPYCANKYNNTWYDVAYCTNRIDPFDIMQSLISVDKFELCLEWLECQSFTLEAQSSVAQDFLIGLLKNERQDFKQALKLLQSLPHNHSVKICKVVLKKVESTSALSFLVNYLLQHCKKTEIIKYKRTLIGIDILKELKDKEKSLYIHLIKDPLLMLEQLLMNCKFETLQKILNIVYIDLQDTGISMTEFDKIIRFYSKKALDFRVSLQRDGIDNKSKSIQDSNLENESNEFIMPSKVPTKEEWIPNDKARECSCCKTVIFSMFNRRHHCRRCGRVVCAICSQSRMQVPGYPSSVPVRVCEDCKCQTTLQTHMVQGSASTPNSEALDYWRLTKDEGHNKTIREEFSFEYAPSISLCLAILNLHSDHKAYTSFLLDRCDEMKQLLYPVNDGEVNPEVDHIVIIKMIKSLLVAAKVKCAKLGFNTGLAHCDRFLSQIDLITTLIHSDCLSLIPSDDMDEHALRKLRDLLTEKEQWTLALDVSTKSGLDTQGVWAAWGKACLKVGYFEQAKEKFLHCLDKVIQDDIDGWEILSYPKELSSKHVENLDEPKIPPNKIKSHTIEEKNSSSQKKSECVKNRPIKDPPLLTEILQILDNSNTNNYYLFHSNQKVDKIPEILSVINNLKAISQGQLTIKHVNTFKENIYYKESLYYLLTYGSYNSILEFYLKHEEFEKCLNYILENDLEPELFFNAVYMYCLKTGNAEKLQEAMKTKDPSLILWKKYLIYVCHCLEKKQSLYILYQLQLFMKDCIRASMTCIRFYTNQATTYTDLCNRMHLLTDAQKHLESELHIGDFSKKRRKSTSSYYSNHDVLTMEMEPSEIDKHINTISRQMEIAKFLGNAEKEGRSPNEFLSLFPDIESDATCSSELPTLFGNQQQKTHLAVLAILCGRDIEEGFGIAFRIMQDYNLSPQKVYSLAGHILALKDNVTAVEQLIKCCRSSGASNTHVICDHVLTHCIKLILQRSYNHSEHILKDQIDVLVRLITDIELKISAYIESKQLKAAYLLAVKYSRVQDVRKILKESDRLGQTAIKNICTKWLQRL
ncbi:protein DDB_G0276689-like [Vespa mandarinia]|uniref:protein DDB_G0276689-like n=1 Tax=Vespa mandarinia TaxID=7446 RepID=UPI001608A97B|nr:protein DDB_G0276689-like [Vespa mandarinia]